MLVFVLPFVAACVTQQTPSSQTSPASQSADAPKESSSIYKDEFDSGRSPWERGSAGVEVAHGRLSAVGTGKTAYIIPAPFHPEGGSVEASTALLDVVSRGGTIVVGLFCLGSRDLSSIFIGYVDVSAGQAVLGRLGNRGPELIATVDGLAPTVLGPDGAMVLRCTRESDDGVGLELFGGGRTAIVSGTYDGSASGSVAGLYVEGSARRFAAAFDYFGLDSGNQILSK